MTRHDHTLPHPRDAGRRPGKTGGDPASAPPAPKRGNRGAARLPLLIALLLVLAIAAWMASGMIGDAPPAPPPQAQEAAEQAPAVAVRRSVAQPVARMLTSQAEVAPKRQVVLRAETAGTVAGLPVAKGSRVAAGELLVRLDMADRQARLARAEAEQAQRQRDHDAASRLQRQGHATEARVSEAFAQLQAARAGVAQIREEIDHVTVEAPFPGILETLTVEPGEVIATGTEIGSIVDIDPLVVEARIPQQNIQQVRPGSRAQVSFVTGETRSGTVGYIAATADPATRTFLVEVEVPNPDAAIPAGISAEVRIPAQQVMAHFVSPAVLALDTDGTLGVKSVGSDGRVRFHAVELVQSETDGVWVSGPPEAMRLIVTGQGFVSPGVAVRAVDAPADAAAAAEADAAPELETPPVPLTAGAAPPDAPPARARQAGPDSVAPATVPAAAAPGRTGTDRPDPGSGRLPGMPLDTDAVAQIQRRLEALGYEPGPIDGLLGGRTRDAIRAFQAARGMTPTGEPSRGLLQDLAAAR